MNNKTMVAVLMLALWLLPITAGATQKTLVKRVQFLDKIQKVEWYKVEGRNIISGGKGFLTIFTA